MDNFDFGKTFHGDVRYCALAFIPPFTLTRTYCDNWLA